MLSRPRLRLKRGRTKSKTVEQCLLAKRPDWQPVLTPAALQFKNDAQCPGRISLARDLLWKTALGARQYGSWPQPPLAKAGTLDEAQVIG